MNNSQAVDGGKNYIWVSTAERGSENTMHHLLTTFEMCIRDSTYSAYHNYHGMG